MYILFCSDIFDDPENDIKNSRNPASVSGHNFHTNLIDGLLENNVNIEVLNTTPIRAYPDYNAILFQTKEFILNGCSLGITIPFISLPILNRITQILSLYFFLYKRISNSSDKSVIVLIWNSSLYKGIPLMLIKKQFPNIRICNVIGDIHGKYGAKNDETLLQRIRNFITAAGDKFGMQSDCFVYLTKYMREALKLYRKPYCIVEALYRVHPHTIFNDSIRMEGEKLIFYAGTLSLEYGIQHLLKAFSLIPGANFKLVIAGSGSGVAMVKDYCKSDDRILYLGVLTPLNVEKYQAQATVLVSPRKSTEPFVKYSFPSKTVECLASGTPYVAHRLPCEPPEYANYIQYPADESDEALAHKLEEICNLPEEERKQIGERGRAFIAREKNPKVMCKRIVDMWRGMAEK